MGFVRVVNVVSVGQSCVRRSGRAWLRTVKLKLREGIRSWSAYTRHETGTKASQAWRRGRRGTSWTSVRRLQAARREEERGAQRAIWEPGDRFADGMRAKRTQKQNCSERKIMEIKGMQNAKLWASIDGNLRQASPRFIGASVPETSSAQSSEPCEREPHLGRLRSCGQSLRGQREST